MGQLKSHIFESFYGNGNIFFMVLIEAVFIYGTSMWISLSKDDVELVGIFLWYYVDCRLFHASKSDAICSLVMWTLYWMWTHATCQIFKTACTLTTNGIETIFRNKSKYNCRKYVIGEQKVKETWLFIM